MKLGLGLPSTLIEVYRLAFFPPVANVGWEEMLPPLAPRRHPGQQQPLESSQLTRGLSAPSMNSAPNSTWPVLLARDQTAQLCIAGGHTAKFLYG